MDTNTVGQNLLDLTSELATLYRQTTYPAKFILLSKEEVSGMLC
jgi:hypothetical protein